MAMCLVMVVIFVSFCFCFWEMVLYMVEDECWVSFYWLPLLILWRYGVWPSGRRKLPVPRPTSLQCPKDMAEYSDSSLSEDNLERIM